LRWGCTSAVEWDNLRRGGDTARTADPGCPKACPPPYGTVLGSKVGAGRVR